MAGELFRIAQLEAYREAEMTEPTMFLSSFFENERRFDTEEIEVDVQRNGESVAVDILPGTGGNLNEIGEFTNKRFIPPMYDEYVAVNAFSGFKRLPGETQYSDGISNMARALARITSGQMECRRKIQRAIEVQARQIFFSSAGSRITLTYPLGGSAVIDFKQRGQLNGQDSTNGVRGLYATPGTNMIGAVETLCNRIRQYGKVTPRVIIFGEGMWRNLQANTDFNTRLDQINRNEGGLMMPQLRDTGAIFHGTFNFNNYVLEMWTYPQFYEAAGSNESTTPYVPSDLALILSPQKRFDKVYGGVPVMQQFEAAEARLYGLPAVPTTMEANFLPYFNVDEKKVVVEAGIRSRPLLIPVSIDTFGTMQSTN